MSDTKEATQMEQEEQKENGAAKSSSPKKSSKKAEEKHESEDSVSEDGEEQVALLEQPVVIEGKRDRKKTERLSENFSSPVVEKELKVPEGKGAKLADCKRIMYFLDKAKGDELKPLHNLLYGRQGKVHLVKKNIRLFCGYDFEKDSAEYKKKHELLNRFYIAGLKFLCDVLDLDHGGMKEQLVERVWEFLLNPTNSGKDIPQPAKKTVKTKSKPKKRKSEGSDKKKEPATKKTKKAEEGGGDAAADDSVSSLSSDEDDEPKPKKKTTMPKVAAPKKKAPKKETPKVKAKKETPKKDTPKKDTPKKDAPKKDTPKKAAASPKKAAPKKKTAPANDESSEDEPLGKPKGPPSDAELVKVIKKLLEGADLQEVTMKTILNQVYGKYPDHDMTTRKDFLKKVVKEIIS